VVYTRGAAHRRASLVFTDNNWLLPWRPRSERSKSTAECNATDRLVTVSANADDYFIHALDV